MFLPFDESVGLAGGESWGQGLSVVVTVYNTSLGGCWFLYLSSPTSTNDHLRNYNASKHKMDIHICKAMRLPSDMAGPHEVKRFIELLLVNMHEMPPEAAAKVADQ